jgi:hypothetical protein
MLRRRLVACILPLMVGTAFGGDVVPPTVGDWAVTRVDPAVSGCPTEAELYRFVELFHVDKPAADAFARQHCIQLGLGTEVMIERDNTAGSKMMCVQPRGDPECHWVPTSAVESKADAYGEKPAERSAESSAVACMKQNGRVLLDKDGNETCRHDLDQWRKASADCLASGGNFIDGGDRNDDWACVKE